MQPDTGMGCVYEGWSTWEDKFLYYQLLSLQTPSGHVFSSEISTAEEMLTRDSCPHVQLVSVHEGVRRFLHHHEDELKSQDPNLLNTFLHQLLLRYQENCLLVLDIDERHLEGYVSVTLLSLNSAAYDTVLQAQANEHLSGNLLHWD